MEFLFFIFYFVAQQCIEITWVVFLLSRLVQFTHYTFKVFIKQPIVDLVIANNPEGFPMLGVFNASFFNSFLEWKFDKKKENCFNVILHAISSSWWCFIGIWFVKCKVDKKIIFLFFNYNFRVDWTLNLCESISSKHF